MLGLTVYISSYEIIADISQLPTTSAPESSEATNTLVPFNGEGKSGVVI